MSAFAVRTGLKCIHSTRKYLLSTCSVLDSRAQQWLKRTQPPVSEGWHSDGWAHRSKSVLQHKVWMQTWGEKKKKGTREKQGGAAALPSVGGRSLWWKRSRPRVRGGERCRHVQSPEDRREPGGLQGSRAAGEPRAEGCASAESVAGTWGEALWVMEGEALETHSHLPYRRDPLSSYGY